MFSFEVIETFGHREEINVNEKISVKCHIFCHFEATTIIIPISCLGASHDHFIQWLTQPRFFSRKISRNLRVQAPTYIRLILIGQCDITRISCHLCRPFVVQNQSHAVEYPNTWHVHVYIDIFRIYSHY
jgi:hypothetical protein